MRIFWVLLVCLFLTSCENDINEVNELFDLSILDAEILDTVEIYYSDTAKVSAIIRSPKLMRYARKLEARMEFPNGIQVDFLNKNNQVSSRLEADFAIRYENSDKIVTKGNVLLTNSNNDQLRSPELIWDESNNKISSDKIIMITRHAEGDTIMGVGIVTDKDFNRFEIKNHYSGNLNIKKYLSKTKG